MWPKLTDAAIVLAVLFGAGIAVLLGSGYLQYLDGASNASFAFPSGRTIIEYLVTIAFGGLLALAALTAGIIRFRRWNWPLRLAWLALMLLPVASGIATMLAVGRNGAEQYERGFQHWAAHDMDVTAVRAWLAKTPLPAAGPMPVFRADWPPALARLKPVDVWLCPSGVIVSFGIFGTWGDQRQVFIGLDPAASDPGILLRGSDWQKYADWGGSPWSLVSPGVYTCVQGGG